MSMKPSALRIDKRYWLHFTRSGMLDIQIYDTEKSAFISSSTCLGDDQSYIIKRLNKTLYSIIHEYIKSCNNSKLLNFYNVPYKVKIINRIYTNYGTRLINYSIINYSIKNDVFKATFESISIGCNFHFCGMIYIKVSKRTARMKNSTNWHYFKMNELVKINQRDYEALQGLMWCYEAECRTPGYEQY